MKSAIVPLALFLTLLAPPAPAADLETARDLIDQQRLVEAEEILTPLLESMETAHGEASVEAAAIRDVLLEVWIRGPQVSQPETLAFAERTVAIKESALGPDHVDTATSVFFLGMLLRLNARLDEAEVHLGRALQIREGRLGPAHADIAASLAESAALRQSQGDMFGAVELFERALAMRAQTLGERHPKTATSHRNLGGVLYRVDRTTEALEHFQTNIEILEENFGPDSPQLVTSLSWLGTIRRRQGDVEAAREIFQRSIDIRRQADPGHQDLGEALAMMASLDGSMGNREAARAEYQESIQILEKALGEDHPYTGTIIRAYGSFLRGEGDYDQSERYLKRSLAIARAKQGEDHPGTALALSAYAYLKRLQGSLIESRDMLERAIAINVATYGKDSWETAWSLVDLGLVLMEMGDFTSAQRNFQEGATAFEALEDPDLHGLAAAYNDLAQVALAQGDLETADRQQTRALETWRSIGASDEGLALANLAYIDYKRGDFEGARALYEEALAHNQTTGGAAAFRMPSVHQGLGQSLRELGRLAEAESHFNTALQLMDAGQGLDSTDGLMMQRDLALLYAATGRAREAMELATHIERTGLDHLRLTLRSLPERQALRIAEARSTGLDIQLALLAESPGGIADTYDAVVRNRAVVLDELGLRHRALSQRLNADQQEIWERLSVTRARLAQVVLNPGGRAPRAQRELVDSITLEKESLERDLADASATFRTQLRQDNSSTPEVTRALPEGATLVSYIKRVDPVAAEDRYHAFVHREGQTDWVPLGPASTVDRAVQSWRDALLEGVAPSGFLADSAERAYRGAAQQLRALVLDPVVPLLPAAGLVFLVPDGALHHVNIAALPHLEGYLVDSDWTFHVLSAERDLLGEPGGPGSPSMLALGSPAFDTREAELELGALLESSDDKGFQVAFRGPHSSCRQFSQHRFSPLAYADVEIEAVTSVWSRQVGGRLQTLLGSSADEWVLKRGSRGHSVLHIATHGFVLGGECAPGSGNDLRPTADASFQGENPLILSGLALAGANQRGDASGDREDGILTAEEVTSLDLTDTDWVVLSACDTGRGQLVSGEGVLGLQRSFRIAGARSLVMSLWPVEDRATADWMRHLYAARFERGLSTAESIAAASRGLRDERRAQGLSAHPFYWAGFVASGDWR